MDTRSGGESRAVKFDKVWMLQQDLTLKCGNILVSFFVICERRNGDGQTENNIQTLPVLCLVRHPAVQSSPHRRNAHLKAGASNDNK